MTKLGLYPRPIFVFNLGVFEFTDFLPDFLPAVDLVTLLALLPPGVPFDDLGVFIFFEELDFDFGRAEGDGDEVREDGDDLLEEDGVEDRSASSTYLEIVMLDLTIINTSCLKLLLPRLLDGFFSSTSGS